MVQVETTCWPGLTSCTSAEELCRKVLTLSTSASYALLRLQRPYFLAKKNEYVEDVAFRQQVTLVEEGSCNLQDQGGEFCVSPLPLSCPIWNNW